MQETANPAILCQLLLHTCTMQAPRPAGELHETQQHCLADVLIAACGA
jgi:hypothetical protein